MTAAAPAPTLSELFAPFGRPPAAVEVPAESLPPPYRKLLDHTHHMTVTVEAHHGCPVDVRVIDTVRTGDDYGRRILLTRRTDKAVVQFGAVRIDLAALPPMVRAEVLAGKTPLGHILIAHDVLRTVTPTAFLKVMPAGELTDWLGDGPVYGRVGVLTVDGRAAIRVCEILAA
jgi:chorismate-pyruvate lyase